MNFLYAGLLPSINFGDYIIEVATQKFLKSYLEEHNLIAFHSKGTEPIKYEGMDRLIIPGCTQLTVNQHKNLNRIDSDKIESYCLAGSLWYKEYKPGYLVRKRIIGKPTIEPDLSIVNKLSGIIGCRDNYTFQLLKSLGYNCVYTGCPTLFISDGQNINDEGYILFSFGRDNYRKQVYYANKIRRYSNLPIIGIVHEENDYGRIKAAGWKFPIIDFRGDIDLYLSYFKNASYVISGRLHGALPALSYGKKVFYFGTIDTRTSIFEDLGVKIYDYESIPNFEKLSSTLPKTGILEYFQSNLHLVASQIFNKQ